MVPRIDVASSTDSADHFSANMTTTTEAKVIGRGDMVCRRCPGRGNITIVAGRAIPFSNISADVTDRTLAGLTGNGHIVMLNLNRRHPVSTVTETTIKLRRVDIGMTATTAVNLRKSAVMVTGIHRCCIDTDVTTGAIHQR